jgi:hypothetical protein
LATKTTVTDEAHAASAIARRQRGNGGARHFGATGAAAQLHRDDAGFERRLDGLLDDPRAHLELRFIVPLGEPVEHHRAGQEHGTGFALPCPRCRARCRARAGRAVLVADVAEGAMPMPPMRPAPRSERMSPNMFSVTITSSVHGFFTMTSAIAST